MRTARRVTMFSKMEFVLTAIIIISAADAYVELSENCDQLEES